MRAVVLLLAILASANVAAEPIDCNALENTTVPFELAYHDGKDNKFVVQVYRDKSTDSIAWVKALDGKLVTKAVLVAGILVSAESTSTYAGKFKSAKTTYTVEGMPKLFDHRQDLKYTITHSTVYADSSTDEATVTFDYKFKSAGKELVGPCMLDVIHGETDSVNQKTGKTSHAYIVRLPKLMAVMNAQTAEPVLDDIKTSFVPTTPIP
jgi:hypothetical protein